ncbi:Uncharacterised protein [uncultured archaeon]|nr:Uncharacterised protein [uncultured archaeon]
MDRKPAKSIFDELYRLMNHLLQNPYAPIRLAVSVAEKPAPYADIIETPHEIHLTVELPNVSPNKLRIGADRRLLEIKASGSDRTHPSPAEGVHNYELPADIQPKSLKITFHNNILSVIAQKARKEKIKIN